MSLPSDITYTGVNASYDPNPASSRNFQINFSTPVGVNNAINAFKGQMLAQQWAQTGVFYPATSISVPLLIGSLSTGYSVIIFDWYGWQLQFYQFPAETDPTNTPGGFPGTKVWGMKTLAGMDQAALLTILIDAMLLLQLDQWTISGSGSTVTISGDPFLPGPSYNDRSWPVNLQGGYILNGPTKGGGWEMTSLASVEHSPVTVAMRNSDALNALYITARINGNACIPVRIQTRPNYVSVVSPYMWNLFRLNDGVNWGSGNIFTYREHYLICAPEKELTQRNDPVDPLTFAAFALVKDRNFLIDAGIGTTAINASFHDGDFNVFPADVGISWLLFNSRSRAAGALLTTADKPVQFQALIGLSPDYNTPLQIVGPVWDMFIVMKYAPLDTLAIAPSGKIVIAYRSQQTPCEATLWLALN